MARLQGSAKVVLGAINRATASQFYRQPGKAGANKDDIGICGHIGS